PGIDDFRNGVATQVKTRSYGTEQELLAQINRDAWALRNAGRYRELRGFAADNVTRVVIKPGDINVRALLIGIPENLRNWITSPTFRSGVQKISDGAQIVIRVVPIRGLRR